MPRPGCGWGIGENPRPVDQVFIALLNALSAGLLLFMLSAGLTLIFSMLGVLNFAHASFYMLGAYLGWWLSGPLGFGLALLLAPLLAGGLGMVCERWLLRRVHPLGHVAELLATFGLAQVMDELVQLVWGRSPQTFAPPDWLQGPAFTLVNRAGDVGLGWHWGEAPASVCGAANDWPWGDGLAAAPGVADVAGAASVASTAEVAAQTTAALVQCAQFPLTRAFIMAVALGMLALLAGLLLRTRLGLVVQAALTHPAMVQALGHDVPRVFMAVFGTGCALAALAGVVGGMTFVTEPGMSHAMGPLLFVVVVVGGLGSLGGALLASLLIGALQTLPLTLGSPWLAQAAPVLPYALLVLTLALRPQGLMGGQRV